MHEFALADAVMRATQKTAEQEGLKAVHKVGVRVGELQQIKKDVFEFALSQCRPKDDDRLAHTEVVVEIVPATFHCRVCRRDFTLAETADRDADADEAIHFVPELAHAFMRCPGCGSPDFDVVAGRGVEIGGIEGER